MFIYRYESLGGGVILVRDNLSILPPAEHNFEHNTQVSWVTPESIIFYLSSIIRQTLTQTKLCVESLSSFIVVTPLSVTPLRFFLATDNSHSRGQLPKIIDTYLTRWIHN